MGDIAIVHAQYRRNIQIGANVMRWVAILGKMGASPCMVLYAKVTCITLVHTYCHCKKIQTITTLGVRVLRRPILLFFILCFSVSHIIVNTIKNDPMVPRHLFQPVRDFLNICP